MPEDRGELPFESARRRVHLRRQPPRRRSRALVAAVLVTTSAVLGALLGALASTALGPRWQSESTVSFTAVSADPLVSPNGNAALTEREVADAAALAVSQRVLDPAAAALAGGLEWTDLQSSITVTPQPGTSVFTITATGVSASEASRRLDAVLGSFGDVVREQVVDDAQSTAEAALQAASAAPEVQAGELQELAARARVVARTADPVEVLSVVPPEQTRPAPFRDTATGAVLGLLLAAALLLLVQVRPTRVGTAQDAGELLGLPAGELRAGALVDGSEGLVDDLRRLARQSPQHVLLVVPAGATSVAAAQQVAALLGDHSSAGRVPASTTEVCVRTVGDPATTVGSSAAEAGAVVLAVAAGAPLREIRASARLCDRWVHPPDAVVVAG